MRVNYKRKSNLSIKMFLSELGENFPKQVNKKLTELESRCFLTRKEADNTLDLKHVEHLQHACPQSNSKEKEYAYGQFVVIDNMLYFSKSCFENDEIMQSPQVDSIYNSLEGKEIVSEGKHLKELGENNIDYVVDSILAVCPQESKAYQDIVRGMVSRASNK